MVGLAEFRREVIDRTSATRKNCGNEYDRQVEHDNINYHGYRDRSISGRFRFTLSTKGSMRKGATCAGAAGSRPASEEGKLKLTEILRSATAVEGIPEGLPLQSAVEGTPREAPEREGACCLY